jgi:hypothetical protein
MWQERSERARRLARARTASWWLADHNPSSRAEALPRYASSRLCRLGSPTGGRAAESGAEAEPRHQSTIIHASARAPPADGTHGRSASPAAPCTLCRSASWQQSLAKTGAPGKPGVGWSVDWSVDLQVNTATERVTAVATAEPPLRSALRPGPARPGSSSAPAWLQTRKYVATRLPSPGFPSLSFSSRAEALPRYASSRLCRLGPSTGGRAAGSGAEAEPRHQSSRRPPGRRWP